MLKGILHDSLHVNYKDRQNLSMLLEIRIVALRATGSGKVQKGTSNIKNWRLLSPNCVLVT
jgi:hypothetical protein